MERNRHIESISPRQEYLETLATVKDIYTSRGLNPLFVGGVIAKAIPLGVIDRLQFDHANRKVIVPIDGDKYTSLRGDGTRDDFDIIVNHPDKDYVDEVVRETERTLKKNGLTHHFVSTEAVRHPGWPKRKKLMQLASGIDVDESGNVRFTFGDTISSPVDPETMQSWEYIFTEDGTEIVSLPSFNPAVFGLRYVMRLPVAHHGGLRAKDTVTKKDEGTQRQTTKFHTLMKLREAALRSGKEQGYWYNDNAWRQFIIHLQHPEHQDTLTHMKGELMNLWWTNLSGISTAMAHGKGIFEEVAKLGNKFGG